MMVRLPLLSAIIDDMVSSESDVFVSAHSGPMDPEVLCICTLEVTRDTSGLIVFGVYESARGDREAVLQGRARMGQDGEMSIEPEDFAKYQSFVEASRYYLKDGKKFSS